MNDGVEQLPGLVVGHPLVERAADALRDAAVDLALDDHRVDEVAAVVHDGVLQDRDLGGLRVGLDDHGVHAGGERRPLRRVEVAALEAGLVVLGDRRLAGVADRELGRRLGRLVEGVAQRVGQHGDRAQVDGRRRACLTRHDAVDDLEVLLGDLERLCGDPQRLLLGALGAPGAIAEPLITAAREAKVPTA